MDCEVKMEVLDIEYGDEIKAEAHNYEPENNEPVGRMRRKRNSTVVKLEQFDSGSDSENDKDDDPEFKPRTNIPAAQPPAKMNGFSLYTLEYKDSVQKQYPDISPAKINVMLANMWREFPPDLKRSYSSRARQLQAGVTPKKRKVTAKPPQPQTPPEEDILYITFCCAWDQCDFQFEVVDECAHHISDQHMKPLCHPDTENLKSPAACRWRGCQREKRCALPFFQYERLYRHMSEEHVLVGKYFKRSEHSRNYIPRSSV